MFKKHYRLKTGIDYSTFGSILPGVLTVLTIGMASKDKKKTMKFTVPGIVTPQNLDNLIQEQEFIKRMLKELEN